MSKNSIVHEFTFKNRSFTMYYEGLPIKILNRFIAFVEEQWEGLK